MTKAIFSIDSKGKCRYARITQGDKSSKVRVPLQIFSMKNQPRQEFLIQQIIIELKARFKKEHGLLF